ncbi:polyprenyl synthetase family protein [Paucidesulfovibrio longus]|uniref:polyprenyl synthetase family protein n=1 Tax=Paucidesulfovibrio longus TaxID=889 RepID=UPI00041A7A2F|nr:polyprenyl synthetase family protein [Paucidesulfovibrio longus]
MNRLLAYFDAELPGVNEFLDTETAKLNGLVRDVSRHVLLGPGKRIRPVLTICTARALGYGGNILPLACALEMLHSATLIHDDILDDADLRRGKTAAHVAFGTTQSVLAGDLLLALANRLGAQYEVPRVSWLLAEGIMATAEGEVLEIASLSEPIVDRDLYMRIIIGKTARLIETACRCGAAVASPDRSVEDVAGAYGLNLGIAFQLVDDALDYVSPTSTMGKPEGGDLREGKITLPLIHLFEDMGPQDAEPLLASIRSGGLDEAGQKRILGMIREGGYAGRTRDAAAEYVAKAKESLAGLPDCEERLVLSLAADFVLSRKK